MEKKPSPELDRDLYDTHRSVKLGHFDQYRGLLFSIAYRMLGSVADAEDMLQETYIKWQEVTDENIRSPRSYLVTILSRLCINHLQSAQVQREEYIGVWLPEPIITDSGNGPFDLIKVDESISMAFLVLLERLTPTERAVFLLREVFEYEYSEIGSIIRQSEVNCRQILKRARQHITALRPRFEIAKSNHDALLESFLKAIGTGELSGLVALLADDVVLRSDGGGKGGRSGHELHRLLSFRGMSDQDALPGWLFFRVPFRLLARPQRLSRHSRAQEGPNSSGCFQSGVGNAHLRACQRAGESFGPLVHVATRAAQREGASEFLSSPSMA